MEWGKSPRETPEDSWRLFPILEVMRGRERIRCSSWIDTSLNILKRPLKLVMGGPNVIEAQMGWEREPNPNPLPMVGMMVRDIAPPRAVALERLKMIVERLTPQRRPGPRRELRAWRRRKTQNRPRLSLVTRVSVLALGSRTYQAT